MTTWRAQHIPPVPPMPMLVRDMPIGTVFTQVYGLKSWDRFSAATEETLLMRAQQRVVALDGSGHVWDLLGDSDVRRGEPFSQVTVMVSR